MEEFLKSIGIEDQGIYTNNGSYVIDIRTYDDYGRYFSLLNKSDKVDEIQDTSMITYHTTTVTFESDDYQLVLQADLDEDLYKLVVTKI